jgi:hypothetical protein
MGKENSKRRSFVIRNRNKRRDKLQALKSRYTQSRSLAEKKHIVVKALTLAPYIDAEAYLKAK